MTAKTAMDLEKEVKSQIENLTQEQVHDEMSKGNVTLNDIRESEKLQQTGKITGSIYAPKGMLEFYADSSLPYYNQEFNKNERIILLCSSGGPSSLAAKTLKEKGDSDIAHLDGGIKSFKKELISLI